jgi:NADH-quinone oxidoreductase subunit F
MDVPGYVSLVAAGRVDDALETVLRTNPLPGVCGRVCGHPCQAKCRRGQLDAPVSIMHLKRYVADNATRMAPAEPLPTTRKEKVAIVGAGPSGLAAAWELRHLGYAVTVFEALPEAGGMLRYGIPAYRLPREVLDRDVDAILGLGVTLELGVRLGLDLPLEKLERDFDAVYLAFGAHRNVKMDLAGEEADGVLGGADFLRQHNLGAPLEIGRRVAVVGGGNTAIDAARTAVRLGADTVAIYYRRGQDDMPALRWEIDAAVEEGIRIDCELVPLRILVDGDRVSGLELARVGHGTFDPSARRRPVPNRDDTFTVKVDTVIAAVGHDIDSAPLARLLAVDAQSGAVLVDTDQRTSRPRVWAGGDAATGPAMVIDAISAGRRAAGSIHADLRRAAGEEATDRPAPRRERLAPLPDQGGPQEAQAVAVMRPSERRRDFREVELGYSREQAVAEAKRCLRCDVASHGGDTVGGDGR